MPEYSVMVYATVQGRVKIRANNEREAIEDAEQADLEDIDVTVLSIKAESVKQVV